MKLKAREWFPAEGTMEPVVADWVISRENDDYKGSSSSKTEVTLFYRSVRCNRQRSI